MSRLYPGSWRVLVVTDADGNGEWTPTEIAAYEDCERLLLALGTGMPFERKRVVRALIVRVATDREDPEPGRDFEAERL